MQKSTQLVTWRMLGFVANHTVTGSAFPLPAARLADGVPLSLEATGVTSGAFMAGSDHAEELRCAVERELAEFLGEEAAALETADPALGVLARLALDCVLAPGKRLRPRFAYWGWRGVAGLAPAFDAVMPALAGLELLHAFALVQDDVMDGSATRRGRPTAHERLAAEHTAAGRAGSAGRFGATGAVLLGDLLLVWADRMQIQARVPAAALLAARRRYDEMRIATIAGQYLDVLGDSEPDAWSVGRALRVARLKTAGYTVTGPLLLGAALAVGEPQAPVSGAYTIYGGAIGEAFQLQDDFLGVFGDPEVTGKPAGDDLRTGKPTVLLLMARRLATSAQLAALRQSPMDADDIDRLADVVAETGAVAAVEAMVERRVETALDTLDRAPIEAASRTALAELAITATHRAA
jgi:geranylgeranyl diphosphate synthase type I